MLRSIGKHSWESVESVLKKKRKATVGKKGCYLHKMKILSREGRDTVHLNNLTVTGIK